MVCSRVRGHRAAMDPTERIALLEAVIDGLILRLIEACERLLDAGIEPDDVHRQQRRST